MKNIPNNFIVTFQQTLFEDQSDDGESIIRNDLI